MFRRAVLYGTDTAKYRHDTSEDLKGHKPYKSSDLFYGSFLVKFAFSDNLFFAWLLEESTPDDDVYSNCSFQI